MAERIDLEGLKRDAQDRVDRAEHAGLKWVPACEVDASRLLTMIDELEQVRRDKVVAEERAAKAEAGYDYRMGEVLAVHDLIGEPPPKSFPLSVRVQTLLADRDRVATENAMLKEALNTIKAAQNELLNLCSKSQRASLAWGTADMWHVIFLCDAALATPQTATNAPTATTATPAERQLIEAAMLWHRAHLNWGARAEDGSSGETYDAACSVFHTAEDDLDEAAEAVRKEREGGDAQHEDPGNG